MKKLTLFAILVIVVIPLVVIAAPQDTLRKAIVHVATMQDENGAWSRLKGEFPSEAESTAWAIIALTMNGVAPEKVDKGVAFLLKEQRPDGSWSNNTARRALLSWRLNRSIRATRLSRKAIQYFGMFRTRGGFREARGKKGRLSDNLYREWFWPPLRRQAFPGMIPWRRMALDWLMGCQNADGGYRMPKGTPSLSFAVRGWP